MKTSAAAEERTEEERGGEALSQEMAEKGGACESLPLSPLPLLIASHSEAEEAGRGARRGINHTHSPHAPRLLPPKGVPKPPQEDVRAA